MNCFKIKLLLLTIISFSNVYTDQQSDADVRHYNIVKSVSDESSLKSIPKLFVYDDCYYCTKVISFLQRHNLVDQIEFINLSSAENLQSLKMISGKTQAPYLVDLDAQVNMAESDDIIEYFIKKYHIQYMSPRALSLSSQNLNMQRAYNPGTFIADVIACHKPVIILISTTWCSPCKQFKPIFLKLAEQFAEECEFICVDGDANVSLVQQLDINYYPAIVCYKNGLKINFDNYRSEKDLLNLIQELVKI